MSDGRIYLRDLRAAKMCAGPPVRAFFERNGLDWSDFKHNGIPIETIEAIGDAMGNEAARVARERESNG